MWRLQTYDDSEAFAQLMRRWQKPIHNLCVRMICDLHRAEDLTQEVFLKVFTKRAEYQPSGRFSTWLWRVALNLCYDELRRVRRRDEQALETESDSDEFSPSLRLMATEPCPDTCAKEQDDAELVRRALLQLPEQYRSVLVLRHYEDLKFREIADVLEISEGTVKSRMAEAMVQLTRLLHPVLQDKPARSSRSLPLTSFPKESLSL